MEFLVSRSTTRSQWTWRQPGCKKMRQIQRGIRWNRGLSTSLSSNESRNRGGPHRFPRWKIRARVGRMKGTAGMEINNLKDMFIAELQEMVSVESQLADALLRMAGAASHPALKDLLIRHHTETATQKRRLVSILQKHDADPAAHIDQAMQALITETKKMVTMLAGDDFRDAGLISSSPQLQHYEIAAYGTAPAPAGQLGLRDQHKLLHLSLEEKKIMDTPLTLVATPEVKPNPPSPWKTLPL